MTPTAIAAAPSRNSCWTEEKVPSPMTPKSVNGEVGTNTPMTLAMLLAPRL